MGKRLIILFFLSAALFEPASLFAWQKEFTRNGVTIYTRKVPGIRFRAFKAVAVIDAPVKSVAAVINDISSQVKWIPDCITSRVLKRISPARVIYYNETKAPVVSRRDVIIESHSFLKGGTMIIRFTAISRPDLVPLKKGTVRLTSVKGSWILSPQGSKTLVTYQVISDPGGSIPAWLADSAGKDIPYRTLMGLRKMSQ